MEFDPGESAPKRVPPGQRLTSGWPVLHVGPIPRFDEKRWDFRVVGLVEKPVVLSYKEFMALPRVAVVADFHCVTTWSKLNNQWEGVPFKEIMKLINLKPEALYVMVHSEGGYTTNLPLELLTDDDVLFADRHNGAPIAPEHGWPLRLIVPKRYAWKSAKWVRGIEFMAEDRPGFWELRGYHNDADPWKEERFWED